MKEFKHIWIIGLLITALIITVPIVLFTSAIQEPAPADPWAMLPTHPRPTSHVGLFSTPLETGSDVTRACLSCHEDAAYQIMQTTHWTWQAPPVEVEGRDEPVSVGKANLLNNFCIGIQSNWTGCTSCHAGYGWDGPDFDFTNEENVDCLICHDQSGEYIKGPAGIPLDQVDLLIAAESVSIPTRENCGVCHFNGGGGNAVKHGDMDETLYFPTDHTDVHMGRHDMLCTDCHQTNDHHISGRSISVSLDNANQISCTDCHAATPHDDSRINDHTDTVACQACHVPSGAVREPTKMVWDWSTAGDDSRAQDTHTYLAIKGSFVYEDNFIPEYAWFNGTAQRYLLGDPLPDPTVPTVLNPPNGDINDPEAMIWPFKVHRANQIYDTVYNWLIQPQTYGEDGYWTHFDWNLAAENGMATVGLPFSGEYGFAPTLMYWPLSHMVQPAEHALQCTSCHGENSRLDWQALGYNGDPMTWGGRDRQELAEYLRQNDN